MNSMIERVARAIATAQTGDGAGWTRFADQARAAIKSMREPTEHQRNVGMNQLPLNDTPCASEVYKAMIDAALDESHP